MSDLPKPSSFVEVINRWPSMAELARDIESRQGVVNQWRNRNSIPAHAFPSIAAAATRRGYEGISVELFAEIAAKSAAFRRAKRGARSQDRGDAHA